MYLGLEDSILDFKLVGPVIIPAHVRVGGLVLDVGDVVLNHTHFLDKLPLLVQLVLGLLQLLPLLLKLGPQGLVFILQLERSQVVIEVICSTLVHSVAQLLFVVAGLLLWHTGSTTSHSLLVQLCFGCLLLDALDGYDVLRAGRFWLACTW